MGWVSQILGRDKLEMELKLENAQFPRDLRDNLSNLSLKYKDNPYFKFLTLNTPSSLKIERKAAKNYVFEQISIHSLNIAPLPP